MQGAMAFQKGLGCVHSLSHSLGGVDPRLHHGTLNAMFLPAVVRFNAGAESMQSGYRLQRLAQAMGLDRCDSKGTEVAASIVAMNQRLGLPTGLRANGRETKTCFDRVIDGRDGRPLPTRTNPRLATRDDYRALLTASM